MSESQPRSRRLLFVILGVGLMVVLLGLLLHLLTLPVPPEPRPEPQPVTLVTSITVDTWICNPSMMLDLVAEVRPSGETILVATSEGKITLLAGEGDTVRSGSIVARLVVRRRVSVASNAGLGLRRAEADLAGRRRELERSRRLLDEGGISRHEFERVRISFEAAAATVEATRGATRSQPAGVDDERILRAPFDGLVLEKHVEIGDAVSPDSPLFRLGDISVLEIAASIGETEALGLKLGDSVQIVFDAYPGETYVSSIARIDRNLAEGALTAEIVVAIPNPGSRIPAGILARMRIESARNERGR